MNDRLSGAARWPVTASSACRLGTVLLVVPGLLVAPGLLAVTGLLVVTGLLGCSSSSPKGEGAPARVSAEVPEAPPGAMGANAGARLIGREGGSGTPSGPQPPTPMPNQNPAPSPDGGAFEPRGPSDAGGIAL